MADVTIEVLAEVFATAIVPLTDGPAGSDYFDGAARVLIKGIATSLARGTGEMPKVGDVANVLNDEARMRELIDGMPFAAILDEQAGKDVISTARNHMEGFLEQR